MRRRWARATRGWICSYDDGRSTTSARPAGSLAARIGDMCAQSRDALSRAESSRTTVSSPSSAAASVQNSSMPGVRCVVPGRRPTSRRPRPVRSSGAVRRLQGRALGVDGHHFIPIVVSMDALVARSSALSPAGILTPLSVRIGPKVFGIGHPLLVEARDRSVGLVAEDAELDHLLGGVLAGALGVDPARAVLLDDVVDERDRCVRCGGEVGGRLLDDGDQLLQAGAELLQCACADGESCG